MQETTHNNNQLNSVNISDRPLLSLKNQNIDQTTIDRIKANVSTLRVLPKSNESPKQAVFRATL